MRVALRIKESVRVMEKLRGVQIVVVSNGYKLIERLDYFHSNAQEAYYTKAIQEFVFNDFSELIKFLEENLENPND